MFISEEHTGEQSFGELVSMQVPALRDLDLMYIWKGEKAPAKDDF